MQYYFEALSDWEGDYVTYGALTNWPSACDWIVPGTYKDVE